MTSLFSTLLVYIQCMSSLGSKFRKKSFNQIDGTKNVDRENGDNLFDIMAIEICSR